MKKKNLKNLSLNKKTISTVTGNKVKGEGFTETFGACTFVNCTWVEADDPADVDSALIGAITGALTGG